MAGEKEKTVSVTQRLLLYKTKIISGVLVVLALLFVIAFVSYRSYVYREYSSYSVVNEVERKTVEDTKVLGFGTEYITYSADGIHCSDGRGNDVWSFPYEMQSPMVVKNGKYLACADYNGRNIYMFDNQGVLGSIKLNIPVKKICISATGVVAAICDDGLVTPISLYYYDGSQIATFRTTMSKSGYPVAIGISEDSKLVAVSYLYLDSGELTTKLAFYNFGDVGQNEADNLVSGYEYAGEIVPTVEFLNAKNAFALANDKLLFYEGKERPVNTANIILNEEVYAVFYGDQRVGIVYLDGSGENKYRMDVYTATGKVENSIEFDMEYTDIFFANDRTIIYNSNEALIYSDAGFIKYKGGFEDNVSLMLPTNNDLKYVIVTPDSIKTIQLE